MVPTVLVVRCVECCFTTLLSPRSLSLATMPRGLVLVLATSTLRAFYKQQSIRSTAGQQQQL
jgi:hypothetical protein